MKLLTSTLILVLMVTWSQPGFTCPCSDRARLAQTKSQAGVATQSQVGVAAQAGSALACGCAASCGCGCTSGAECSCPIDENGQRVCLAEVASQKSLAQVNSSAKKCNGDCPLEKFFKVKEQQEQHNLAEVKKCNGDCPLEKFFKIKEQQEQHNLAEVKKCNGDCPLEKFFKAKAQQNLAQTSATSEKCSGGCALEKFYEKRRSLSQVTSTAESANDNLRALVDGGAGASSLSQMMANMKADNSDVVCATNLMNSVRADLTAQGITIGQHAITTSSSSSSSTGAQNSVSVPDTVSTSQVETNSSSKKNLAQRTSHSHMYECGRPLYEDNWNAMWSGGGFAQTKKDKLRDKLAQLKETELPKTFAQLKSKTTTE